MHTHHVHMETKQTSLSYQKRQNMLRKLKWLEMDFTMTTQEPVEQVKATEVVIMAVRMMEQTTFCRTLSMDEVPLSPGVGSRPPDEEDAPPVHRETVVHNRYFLRENDKTRRMVAMTKQSCQPPHTDRITRNQVKISANALIITAKALPSATSDSFTYAEAMDSPKHEHWKQPMEEECTSILLNNTFTTVNSQEVRQL